MRVIRSFREWNKNAHSRVFIAEEEILDMLETWRKEEIKECRALPRTLVDRIRQESAKALYNLAQMWAAACLKVPTAVDAGLLLAMVFAYVESANATDFNTRVAGLEHIARAFGTVDPKLRGLLRNCVAYFSQFGEAVEASATERTKQATKAVADVLKVFSGKKRLQDNAVQLSRQIRKVETECREILSATLPAVTPSKSEKKVVEAGSKFKKPTMTVSNVELEDSTQIMTFSGLGTASETAAKMRKPMSGLVNALSSCGEAASEQLAEAGDTLDAFQEQLASKELDKQRYKANKVVEQFFKDFRELGLSFRVGSMYDASARNVLSEFDLSTSSAAVMRCLAQRDALARNLKVKRGKHVTPIFLERAAGFANHSIAQVSAQYVMPYYVL